MKIPMNVVDNRPLPFPVGVYNSELGETEDRWTPDNETMFVRTNWINNSPADDASPDPGNRIIREDICVQYKGESLYDYEEVTEEMPFLLRRAAGLLAGLALAFGAVERDAEGGVDFELSGFVSDIREGDYNGGSAKVQVEHNSWKPKDADPDDPPRVDAQVRRFAPTA